MTPQEAVEQVEREVGKMADYATKTITAGFLRKLRKVIEDQQREIDALRAALSKLAQEGCVDKCLWGEHTDDCEQLFQLCCGDKP